MIKKLLTVKEYCKVKEITDAGARKHIQSGKVPSVEIDGIAYVVIESAEIDTLKASLRSARERTKTLDAKLLRFTDQSEKIEKLEAKIESLEAKLDAQRDSKEKLYEQVIGEYNRLLPR